MSNRGRGNRSGSRDVLSRVTQEFQDKGCFRQLKTAACTRSFSRNLYDLYCSPRVLAKYLHH